MFSTSSQCKYWCYSGEGELSELKREANERYISNHSQNGEPVTNFLTPEEEYNLCRHYEYVMKEFCTRFQPPMPRHVLGSALCYLKRFYIHNSVMDYHPRDIMLTSVFLACKVDEFNVSLKQFVMNLKGNRERYADMILGFELQLMQMLHYHLVIHNPFRPLEGLLIHMKTMCKYVADPERLRKNAEEFLDRSLNTDACLIFAPSQISLAALLTSAAKEGINLDSYVTDTLIAGVSQDDLKSTIQHIKRIKYMVKNVEAVQRDPVRVIEKKLEQCRNHENNPDSEIYKRKLDEIYDEHQDQKAQKRAKLEMEEQKSASDLTGVVPE